MTPESLARLMRPVTNRLKMLLSRAVVTLVDDAPQAQTMQISLFADESHEAVERFHAYGFTSNPLPGAEAAVAFMGGARSHGIVIAVEDRRYRLRGLRGGEVALYDDQGQKVLLGRDGIVIMTDKPIEVRAKTAKVIADRVDLGGEGGAAVARVGDAVSNGVITGGSGKVFAA